MFVKGCLFFFLMNCRVIHKIIILLDKRSNTCPVLPALAQWIFARLFYPMHFISEGLHASKPRRQSSLLSHVSGPLFESSCCKSSITKYIIQFLRLLNIILLCYIFVTIVRIFLHISNYFFEGFQYLSNVKYKHGIQQNNAPFPMKSYSQTKLQEFQKYCLHLPHVEYIFTEIFCPWVFVLWFCPLCPYKLPRAE